MQVVIIACAVVGVIFAAVAAWGAVMTVQLTRQMVWGEGRRRLMEALVTVEYTGLDLEEGGSHQLKEMSRFRDAQRELHRAWVAAAWGMYGDDDVLEPLDMLLRAMPRDPEEPGAQFELLSGKQVAEMADQAITTLPSSEYAKPPRLRSLFADWAYREWMYRLRHPREWRALTNGRDQGDEGTILEPPRTANQEKRVAFRDAGGPDDT